MTPSASMPAAATPLADVVPALLWWFRSDREDGFSARAEPNPAGHGGDCWCGCDCADHARDREEDGCVAGPPYYGRWVTRFYGDDAPRQPVVAVTRRIWVWWHEFRMRHRWGSYRPRRGVGCRS